MRSTVVRRTLGCTALAGASLFTSAELAIAQDAPTTTQLDLGGATPSAQPDGAAPDRIDAGAGGAASQDTPAYALVALASVGAVAVGAAGLRARRLHV